MNLAGVKRILAMEEDLQEMRRRIAQLEASLENRAIPMPAIHAGVQIVPLSSVFSPPWRRGPA